jgi:hypothetical protein
MFSFLTHKNLQLSESSGKSTHSATHNNCSSPYSSSLPLKEKTTFRVFTTNFFHHGTSLPMRLLLLKPLPYALAMLLSSLPAWTQEAFLPPAQPAEVQAVRTSEAPIIDGILSESSWNTAHIIKNFTQQNPVQGSPASGDSEVRIMFDSDYLYVAAFNRDSIGTYGIRLQNMQRDFSLDQNDFFGFNIDTYLDKRTSFGFFVSPAGAQSDRMYGGEEDENVDWDALWYAKTMITDSGWTVEIALPWKTLRYPEGAQTMGIIFSRGIRRNFEFITFPPVPRAYEPSRMIYEALLIGIEPPPPAAMVQVNPYLLFDAKRTVQETPNGKRELITGVPKIGGEVKWAITPNSVLDITVNTDFAQADADRQVVNLSRFSVFFPERRQFFLENASLFYTGYDRIQPFFSRSIGLDNAGNPVPIDAGARFVAQTPEYSVGGLLMRQRGHNDAPASWFGVGRYVKNISDQSRVGALVTVRNDEGFIRPNGTVISNQMSGTATIDGLLRPSQIWAAHAMASMSFDPVRGRGFAGAMWSGFTDTWGYAGVVAQYMDKNYTTRTGFLGLEDFINLNPAFDLDLRPEWLPSFIRSYGPDGDVDFFWTSDGRFLQGNVQCALLDLEMQTGGDAEYRVQQSWQQMDGTFNPLGILIRPGLYTYTRHRFKVSTDQSAIFGGVFQYNTGGFFDGFLHTIVANVRFAPVANVELSATYEFNHIQGLGKQITTHGDLDDGKTFDTHLLGMNTRLALNPQTQLIGFVQWNSAAQRTVWNVRLAWEYQPLSFLYVVFNSNDAPFALQNGVLERRIVQQGIAKITLLKQL